MGPDLEIKLCELGELPLQTAQCEKCAGELRCGVPEALELCTTQTTHCFTGTFLSCGAILLQVCTVQVHVKAISRGVCTLCLYTAGKPIPL